MSEDGRLPKINCGKSFNVFTNTSPKNRDIDEIESGYKTPDDQYVKKLDKPPYVKRKGFGDKFLPKILN